jgi:hypothetical protein
LPPSGHNQRTRRSYTVILEISMHRTDDSQIFGNFPPKLWSFRDVETLNIQNMDVLQRSVIFYYRSKQRDYRGIHTKQVRAYGQHACPAESVKCWVREYDRGGRDPADSLRAGRPRSDIAEAVSHILSTQPFSSTTYITAQLRTSRDLVKKTRIEVLGMKIFSL